MAREIMGPAGQIHVDDGGSGGLPVVFIHSFAGSGEHWSNQLDHLRTSRRAVAFDLRGHGRSEAKGNDDLTVEDLADDIGTVVDGLGLQRVALVGHSIGGSAAIAYAASNPDRVAGLLLVGTPGRMPMQQADQVMSAMSSNYQETMAGYWDRLLTDATPTTRARIDRERASMPEPAAMTLIRASFAYDPLPDLRDYQGLVETVTIGDSPADLHKQLPDTQDVKITGTSHWAQLDRPDEFDRILDSFLARVDDAERGREAVDPEPSATAAGAGARAGGTGR
jgi:pimeloyl-ACP methyl ester carboxylesterase